MDSSTQFLIPFLANPAVAVLVLIALLIGFLLGRLSRRSTRNREATRTLQTQTPPPNASPATPVIEQSPTSRSPSLDRQQPAQQQPTPPPRTPEPIPPAAQTPTRPQTSAGREQQKITAQLSTARIHTRTGTNQTGQTLSDPYRDQERQWSTTEKEQTIKLYREGEKVFSIARRMGIDQQQVAICLIRELFHFEGEIDDRNSAPRNGKTYAEEELAKLRSYYEAGVPIADIASAVERTVLGAGWRLIDLQMP